MAKAKKYINGYMQHSEGYTTTYIPKSFKFPTMDDINKRIKNKPVTTDKTKKQNISRISGVSTSYTPAETYSDSELKAHEKNK